MPPSQQPKGDGSSVVRPNPPDLSPDPKSANGKTTQGNGASPRPHDATEPGVREAEDIFFHSDSEPTDDSPTVISRTNPKPVSSDEVFSGTLRGKRLAHFELIEPIGVGGMAAVIRARDTQLDRQVALKILPPEMATDVESVRRFHQEARSAARLDHENIARVFFCGEDQGLHFIAFEFVEGPNLRTILERRGRLPVAETIHYMLQIATGLEHAASRGVVHRDIKPSNIIVSSNGRAKLVDMGLARSMGPQTDQSLTQSGVTLGTFDYISPEQALEPRDADVRSDIYSLGCTFYHVLTGQAPVPEGTAAKKLHHHQHVPPVDPRQLNPEIPDEVAAILGRMMTKDPKDRYQSVAKLVQHLIVVAQKLGVSSDIPQGPLFVDAPLPEPPRARPILLGALAAAVLVGLVLVLGQFNGSSPPGNLTPPTPPFRHGNGPQANKGDPNTRPRNLDQGADKGNNPEPKTPTKATFDPREPSNSWESLPRRLANFLDKNETTDEVVVLLDKELELGSSGSGDEYITNLLFKSRKVTIQPHPDLKERPTIRLRYDPNREHEDVLSAFEIHCGEATLRGLKFVVDARASRAALAAVRFVGDKDKKENYRITDCEFFQVDPSLEPFPAGLESDKEALRLASVILDTKGPTSLDIQKSYFARVQEPRDTEGPYQVAQNAVKVIGPGRVNLTNCALAPHTVLFHLAGTGNGPAQLKLQYCSAMAAGDWTAFKLEEAVPAQLQVTGCLFSRVDNESKSEALPPDRRAVLIRQLGETAGTLTYTGSQNRYHQLSAYWIRPIPGEVSLEITEWKTFLGSKGNEEKNSQELKPAPSPLQESDPLKLLGDNKPEKAFLANLKLKELRLTDPYKGMVGVRSAPWGNLYPSPLPALPEDKEVILAAKDLIVDPSVETTGNGVYRKLEQALGDIKQRGTIRIRHNGLLPIDPIRLEKAALDITIQPDQGCHPILVLGDTAEQDAFLFRIHDGKLTLDHLEFLLEPRRGFRSQALVEMIGEGSCTFKGCLVTLDPVGKTVPLMAVRLADPAMVMKMDPPAPAPAQSPSLNFEDCFFRGEGDFLHVGASRPFNLDARNCLLALSGSCLNLRGNPDPPASGPVCIAQFDNVTTFLDEHLIRLEAGKDIKTLVRMEVKASDCIFASRSGSSLIHLDGPVTNDEKMRSLLRWEGKHNAYLNFMNLLDQKSPEDTPRLPYGPAQWKEFSGEREGQYLPRLKEMLPDLPTEKVPLTRMGKPSFKAKVDGDQPTIGANLDKLPTPAGPTPAPPEE